MAGTSFGRLPDLFSEIHGFPGSASLQPKALLLAKKGYIYYKIIQ